jgi:hypothetical protein
MVLIPLISSLFFTATAPSTSNPEQCLKNDLARVSDIQSECEVTSEPLPAARIRSLSVDEPREASGNDVNARKQLSGCKDSALAVSQQRSGPARFCRKCGHVIAASQ